ncbi:MAG TPA: transketolase C-terminal domain-containing protein, partial [Actinoallomurus sp.]|nr:transketolase C-terminal domain-containing protein [Actinoallomurus sp.]
GYAPAENDEEEAFHSPGLFDPATGRKLTKSGGPTWTKLFSDELVRLGAERPDIVAITAAMLHPTGLASFAEVYPERTYDVGIAEQHAVTSAAGLAFGGMHPVVAVYATFLNRAFDQLLMDVALHRLPVTVVLDRAGVTGDDGASHNGMWDLSILQVVPGLRVAAPRDGARLTELLREAVEITDGPTVVRFPKGPVGGDIEAVERTGGVDVLVKSEDNDVLLVAAGAMAGVAVEAATLISAQGIGVTVVDPRWIKPLDEKLIGLGGEHRLVAVVEDNCRVGGVGDAVARLLRDSDVDVPVRTFGIPQKFLDHAKRAQILTDIGLTPQGLARDITALVAHDSVLEPTE